MQLDSPNSQVQPGNLEKYEVGILLLHFSQITRSLWSLSLSLSFCSSFSFSLVSLSRSRLLVIRQAKTLFFSHVVNLAGRHVLWFLCPPLSRFHAEWTCTAHERFHDKAEDFGHRFTPVAHEASNISSAVGREPPSILHFGVCVGQILPSMLCWNYSLASNQNLSHYHMLKPEPAVSEDSGKYLSPWKTFSQSHISVNLPHCNHWAVQINALENEMSIHIEEEMLTWSYSKRKTSHRTFQQVPWVSWKVELWFYLHFFGFDQTRRQFSWQFR